MQTIKYSIFIGVFLMSNLTLADNTYKYGYVPQSFPRDPVEVNQFAEHILIGQVLEPLIETDKFGNVVAGLAESWKFSKDGLSVELKIANKRKFSNGKELTAKDVKYTLNRILEKKSQSSNFLSSIQEVKILNDHKIEIKLKDPNVAILKALSRDQVGIVPENWNFDKKSNEALIGTGPYRLLKLNDKWHFVVNELYPNSSSIVIKNWELLYFTGQGIDIPQNEIPDFVPCATQAIKDSVLKLNNTKAFEVFDQVSFAQTSAWWHPSGANYDSREIQNRAMDFIEYAFQKGSEVLKQRRATGVIPKGVSGHTTESKLSVNKPKINQKKTNLRIAYSGSMFDEFIKQVDLKKIAKEFNFDLEVVRLEITDLPKISENKPDMVFGAWAGGFNDPEGFIALLSGFLGKDFKAYIGSSLSKLYLQARSEQDWTKRSTIFRELNERLRSERYMAPGWGIPLYVIGKDKINEEEATFRYTPRLHLVKIDAK